MPSPIVTFPDLVSSYLLADRAGLDLRDYFCEPAQDRSHVDGYTGRLFEQLGGGGDAPGTCGRVTAEDLVAVQALSVQVPIRVAAQLLHGSLGHDLAALLSAIPTDVALGTPAAAGLVSSESPASLAWALLEGQPQVGWVTAGKLLARKRPKLLPVYDDVVRCALGAPPSFWQSLHGFLLQHSATVEARLSDLRKEADVPATVSDLRMLDVIVWMAHHEDHRAGRCAAE